jgi:hypothetical protein
VSAYVICHSERPNSPKAIGTRAQLGKRISDLWTGTLHLDGAWIVHCESTSDEIRDELVPCLGPGDALFVVGAGHDAAWTGFEVAATDWLLKHI